jgi:hypothetical protein
MNEPINLDYKTIYDLFNKLRFEDNLRQLFERAKVKEENDWFIPVFYVHDEIIIEVPVKTLLLEYKDENKVHND